MVSVLGVVVAGALGFVAYNLYSHGALFGENPAAKKTQEFLKKSELLISPATETILRQEAQLEQLEASETDQKNAKTFDEKVFVETVVPLVPKTLREKQ